MRQIICYAVVSKKNPRLSLLDVYPDKSVQHSKDEQIIEVSIKPTGRKIKK
jgi:hypothetical protein